MWGGQRLSPDCEDQIRVILQESALDYRLDPQLQIQCAEEVCCSSLSHTHTVYSSHHSILTQVFILCQSTDVIVIFIGKYLGIKSWNQLTFTVM